MTIAIIIGSKSDREVIAGAEEALQEFGVDYGLFVVSSHRAPNRLKELVDKLEQDDCKCIIAAAGLSAHLPGSIASITDIPVIGVPVSKSLSGIDSLLSIVQMPKGVPVATVGIDNSYNAAMLSLKMLSAFDKEMRIKLRDFRLNVEKGYTIEQM